ncbi:hypothetical protein [Phenylobacterium sp.]|uniref:hypothetical protein n=1 Tax=Phenylobacterium sp. TaxID=1871053 RepID=UPI002FCB2F68
MTDCPKPGEIRVINGQQCRFIERELEGDVWEVLEPATIAVRSYSMPFTRIPCTMDEADTELPIEALHDEVTAKYPNILAALHASELSEDDR